MLEEKTIQFANFNITFGENEEAMLMHFEDIVFPAFTGGYIRGKENPGIYSRRTNLCHSGRQKA